MENRTIYSYTLLRKLGTGGMAEVWYAENKLGKRAAVKILSKKLSDDENIKVRFESEARVMVKLNHPNIRQVYDYGMIEERPCIIMEYLDGEDLGTLIKKGGEFSQEQIVRWWNQMSSALNYTHGQGIVHRDIKPSNIFITNEGNVELLDFGIAKVADNYLSTLSGMSMGTPMYMSPEQVISSKHIDYRSDVYSLAVTFVHLLGGKAPYSSDMSVYSLHKSIVEEPLDLSGIPLEWRDFLSPYLAKQPEARPQLMEYCTADTADTKISEPKAATKQETTSELKAKAAPKTTDEALKDVGTKIDNKSAGKENPSGNKVPEPDYKKPDKKVDGKENKSPVSKGLLIGIFAGVLLLLGVVLMVVNQLERKETVARQLALLEYERDSLEKMQMYKDSLHREEENAKQKEIEKLRKAQKSASQQVRTTAQSQAGSNGSRQVQTTTQSQTQSNGSQQAQTTAQSQAGSNGSQQARTTAQPNKQSQSSQQTDKHQSQANDCSGQLIDDEEFEEEIPLAIVEEKPKFRGGEAIEFAKWVYDNLVYPEIAKENAIQGRVMLQFTIEKDGRVSKVTVLRGVDSSLDKEAVRVVSSSPKWTPGRQRNKPVRVRYTIPIIFQLR